MWNRISVIVVSSEGPTHLVALIEKQKVLRDTNTNLHMTTFRVVEHTTSYQIVPFLCSIDSFSYFQQGKYDQHNFAFFIRILAENGTKCFIYKLEFIG